MAQEQINAGALIYMGESLGWPSWFTDGTPFSSETPAPSMISRADDLIAAANLFDHVDPFELAVRFMRLPLAGMSATTALGFQIAPTLGHALEARAIIHSRTAPHILISFERDEREGGIRLHSDILGGRMFDTYAISLLGLFHALAEGLAPQLNRTARIEASITGSHQSLFAAEISCPVAFGAAQNRLTVSREALDQPNPRFDAGLWELVERDMQRHPGRIVDLPSRNVLSRIRVHLDQHRVPRLKQIAEELDMSERTIVRLLHAEGTSYRLLVDAERKARVLTLLANKDVELAEISGMLGFSDRPSFWRTFRRWFGVTPSQYRRD